jgi:arabinose-5-phosphate isomerase
MSGIYGEARRVFETEMSWLLETLDLIEEGFESAVELLSGAHGRIVVSGMGKSGHIGGKIAATLTSTGTPAFFLHPAEAVHGDIGLVQKGDAALVLSKSGETPEVAALLPCFRRLEVPVVAMVSKPDSTLGRAAAVVLRIPDRAEACPYNLAPTASTTSMLVLGDALAMALLRLRDFSPDDFAEVHPGGILGRKLLTRVSDIMTGPPLPLVDEDSTISDALPVMTAHRGVCFTRDAEGRLSGIFVYGDLGRLLRTRPDALSTRVGDVVVRNPAVASPGDLASSALARMEKKGITSLVVVDSDGRVTGMVYLHDIMRAGIY